MTANRKVRLVPWVPGCRASCSTLGGGDIVTDVDVGSMAVAHDDVNHVPCVGQSAQIWIVGTTQTARHGHNHAGR
jgi:hypothetical protein